MIHKRDMKIKGSESKIKLRIVLDRYSAEIFINDGQQTMTSTFYTPLDAQNITFESNGKSIINVEKHDIVL